MSKRIIIALISIINLSLTLVAANPQSGDASREQWVLGYISNQLDSLQARLSRLQTSAKADSTAAIKHEFAGCRAAYKRVEAFVEYYYPASALRINGAALLEAEPSEPEEPLHPTGFQVIEEILFADDTLHAEARLSAINEIGTMIHDVRRVQNYVSMEPAPLASDIFEALKLNLYRLIAKGISGFDSPVVLQSREEAVQTLHGLKEVLIVYNLPYSLLKNMDAAITYLQAGKSFNNLDRAAFLTGFLLPLMEGLQNFRQHAQIHSSNKSRAVRTDAAHFFQPNAFDAHYFAPAGVHGASPGLIALGHSLFHDPALSATRTRSCASCHNPSKAYADGLPHNHALAGGQQLLRNTPTLLNAALQPVQFADSRIAFLEDQIHDVISNKQEMGGDFAEIIAFIKKKPRYRALFEAAFPGHADPWQAASIKKALAAYVRSLVIMDSRFDRYMQGDARAMNSEEIRGFNLFMGKAKCGTCHFSPLFSGAVPPLFDKMESEVLGVPSNTDTLHPRLDDDLGKYYLYRMPHQRRSFKTPGLRNVALTAPYMHNGIYKTLEEVMAFYDRGGGAGLRLEVPNQTLPADRLNLSATEQRAVIAFLKALTDSVSQNH